MTVYAFTYTSTDAQPHVQQEQLITDLCANVDYFKQAYSPEHRTEVLKNLLEQFAEDDTLVVSDLNKLARKESELVEILTVLRDKKVKLISVKPLSHYNITLSTIINLLKVKSAIEAVQ